MPLFAFIISDWRKALWFTLTPLLLALVFLAVVTWKQKLYVPTERLYACADSIVGIVKGLPVKLQRFVVGALQQLEFKQLQGGQGAGVAELAETLIVRSEQAWAKACTLTARYANMRTQLAIERHDAAGAVAQAALAESLIRREDEEAANALRLTPQAIIISISAARGIAPLAEALSIDKRPGASRKVSRGLLLLGTAERECGNAAEAQGYLRRALEVARADVQRARCERQFNSLPARHRNGSAA